MARMTTLDVQIATLREAIEIVESARHRYGDLPTVGVGYVLVRLRQRMAELEREQEPVQPAKPMTCRVCDAHDSARDDTHNSWVCQRCGGWMGQIAPVQAQEPVKA
jgi:ribosomal protein L37AE/L43A